METCIFFAADVTLTVIALGPRIPANRFFMSPLAFPDTIWPSLVKVRPRLPTMLDDRKLSRFWSKNCCATAI